MTNFAAPVTEWMSTPIHKVDKKTPAIDAERVLTEHSISALGVTDGNELVGVVSRTDLLSSSSAEPGETFRVTDAPVSELMTANPIIVTDDTPLSDVAKLMLKERIHRVFVEQDGAARGVVSTKDLMRAVVEKRVKTPVIEIATKGVVKVQPTDPIALAVERLDLSNKHGLVVADGHWPIGTFSQLDALECRARDPRTEVEEVMNLHILCLPPDLPLHRAAHQALTLGVRRIILVDHEIVGVVSTFDFARIVR